MHLSATDAWTLDHTGEAPAVGWLCLWLINQQGLLDSAPGWFVRQEGGGGFVDPERDCRRCRAYRQRPISISTGGEG